MKKTKLLRPDQIADRLNVSKRQAYRLIDEGHFMALKVGGCLRVTSESVDDFISRQISIHAVKNGLDEKSVSGVT